MMVAIHQPHYFPWLGYLAKMASVDKFILMDTVQLENKSYMCRNRILNRNGEIIYLTIPCLKKGYREKKNRDIKIDNSSKWQKQQKARIREIYKYSPYFSEVMEKISFIFEKEYEYLIDVTCDSIKVLMEILDINTEIIFQSDLDTEDQITEKTFTKEEKRCNDVLLLCKSVGADGYLTGTGASVNFIDEDRFVANNIKLFFQKYEFPKYEQRFSKEFIPNISTLDLLLNMGIRCSREIFWDSIKVNEMI